MSRPASEAPPRRALSWRAVAAQAVYVWALESAFAALCAVWVAGSLNAAFGPAGGLLEAARAPGAPLLVEGLLPILFHRAHAWVLPLLGVAALHALLAPLVHVTWLVGLAAEGSVGSALRRAGRLYVPALRVRVLLLVPTVLGGAGVALAVTYAQLVFRALDARAADIASLVALVAGLVALSPLRVLADLAHAALVSAQERGARPSARGSVGDGLRALSLRRTGWWALSAACGGALLTLGLYASTLSGTWLAVFGVQLAAYGRYASRGVWLALALASVSGRRLGSDT